MSEASPATAPTEVEPSDIAALVDRHLATWTETDPRVRRELLRTCWEPDGSLVDPPLAGHGLEGIDTLMAAMQTHYPEHRFVRTTEIDLHHDTFRFGWELRSLLGAVALSGADVGLISPRGRLQRICGFFGDLVPLPSAGAVA